ncbi:hypothetical protein W7S_20180 [Mycobacterium sp. MOTT36Y]|nr:hypothetical protein W7S_20180 [Mycobacterium sp. MOTT36Y]
MTAGEALRATMDAALADASEGDSKDYEWSEHELHHLEAASRAADRVELLQRALDAAAAANDPALAVKISAELRACDKAIGDHLARVQIGEGPAKSERHQRAANSRWDSVRKARDESRLRAVR